MESYYYVFDMDGTLFFTDKLNNESYNFALIERKYKPINTQNRITREVVKNSYPEIDEQELARIIHKKQEYFINNISLVQKNIFLFDILNRTKKDVCILWTSAEKRRAESIVEAFTLQNFFNRIFLSVKKNILKDIEHICLELSCTRNNLCVFENDIFIAKELERNNVNCFLFIRS